MILNMTLVFKDFEEWLRKNKVSSETVGILRQNGILSIPDLKLLTSKDIRQFHLLIGEKNRLKNAIQKLHE